MTAHTKGSGLKWVGRAIRRVEDPALLTGQGRFTADLPAAHWVRFVRSPVAAGKIAKIDAPDGAHGHHRRRSRGREADPADAAQVQLQAGRRSRCWPTASCALSASRSPRSWRQARQKPRTWPSWSSLRSTRRMPVTDALAALAPGAPQVHAEAPGNVILEGKVKTPGFDAAWSGAHKHRQRRRALAPAERDADGGARRPRRLRCRHRPRHADLHHADAASHAHRHRRRARHAGSDLRVIAPDVGGGFGQKMSLCAEYVVLVWLARKLKSSVAWTEDRRENLIAGFHARDQYITLEGAFDKNAKLHRAQGRHRLQCRRLFLLPDHLRRRAADGDGGNARALRRAAVSNAARAACSPTPAPWRPIAACRGRSSPSRWNG